MHRSLVLSILVLAAACGSKEPQPAGVATVASSGVDLDGMGRSLTPVDDFVAYASGGWLARTEIPADRSNWGTGTMLTEATSKQVAELIQDAAAHAPADSEARKVGDFYATYLDEAAIESKGLGPLQPALDRIAAITNAAGLARELGGTIRADVDALNSTNFETPNIFGLWVAQDLSDPSRYSPFLLQGGLGMPDRDYYLEPAARMAEYRTKYEAHLAKMLEIAKQPDAAAKANRIVALEKRIAEAHVSREESADVQNGNNHWT